MGVGEEDSAGWGRRDDLCGAAGFTPYGNMEGGPWNIPQDAVCSVQDALSC